MPKYRKVTFGIFSTSYKPHTDYFGSHLNEKVAWEVKEFDVRKQLKYQVEEWIKDWESRNPSRPYKVMYRAFPESIWITHDEQKHTKRYHSNWCSLDWDRYPFVINLELFKDPYD